MQQQKQKVNNKNAFMAVFVVKIKKMRPFIGD
jgi:hypothetical protein